MMASMLFRPRSNIHRQAGSRRDTDSLVVFPMSSLAGLCKEDRSARALGNHSESVHPTTHSVAIPGSLALGALGNCRLANIRCNLATAVAAGHSQHAGDRVGGQQYLPRLLKASRHAWLVVVKRSKELHLASMPETLVLAIHVDPDQRQG